MSFLKNIFLNNLRILKIIKFNSKIFKKKKIDKNKILLCEFSNNKITQVAFSYLVNNIMNKENCECLSYINLSNSTIFDYIKILVNKLFNFNLGNYGIYKSFNISNYIFIKNNHELKNKVLDIIEKINFKNKRELLNFKLENILIGDLIYDTYLKNFGLTTVDLNDKKLKNLIIESINQFYFWVNFFEKKNVISVIVSDTVYTSSMVARIACNKSIPTFQCNWNNICKINKKDFHAYSKFNHYNKEFKNLKSSQKIKALEMAKLSIEKRLKGEKKIDDMIYTPNSSWHSDIKTNRVFKNTNKKKILIASHSFIDGPHIYGPDSNIFPDFCEWLEYVHELSKETDYEFYIKNHPDSPSREDQIFKDFIKNKTNFFEIPKFCSHRQLLKEKIDCVLTVNGTVAWEFAYFNIPVITAAKNNPHINYDFCSHATTIEEYGQMIKNFQNIKINFKKENIYEFYFMHNIYSRSKWLIFDYDKLLNEIKGYDNLSKIEFYEYWIKNFKIEQIQIINKHIDELLNSTDLYIKNKVI